MRRRIGKASRCWKTGKASYRDELSATVAMRLIADRSERQDKPVRVYECEFCAHYHLTSRGHRT